jgi:hypothetical protein
MKLNDDQARRLKRVEVAGKRLAHAQNQLDAARESLRSAAIDALDAGVPQARVAAAAGVGRMGVWRWLKGQTA